MFHPFSFWGIRPAILARMVKRDGMSFQPIGAGGRQAAFCAGQAALPEAGAPPEGVFSPGLAFSWGLWGILGDFLGAGGDLFGPPGRCFTPAGAKTAASGRKPPRIRAFAAALGRCLPALLPALRAQGGCI